MAAFRAGEPGRAAALSEAVLRDEPGSAAALYVLGVARLALGDTAAAARALDGAISFAPENASFHITRGTIALEAGEDTAAEACFRTALSLAPGAVAAHGNLGTALKRQGRLGDAVEAFRAALALGRGSRWWGTPPEAGLAALDPAQAATFATASRAKLVHDIEQLDHLAETGRLDPALDAERARYRTVLAGFGGADDPGRPRPLGEPERQAIGASFNRVVHRPAEPRWRGPALGSAFDAAELERCYRAAAPNLIVIDDFLAPAALVELQRFCREATIWFDCKEHGGYLGAYLHEGFDHPALLALAAELPARLPGIVGPHRLAQMWAYKYGQAGGGTRKHADKAAVNVNFWITPDAACLEPEASGLTVHDVAAPPDWSFERYNFDTVELERRIAAQGRKPTHVPYRCNRAVIFDSSLIHESGAVRFRPGYENRRINVTMLFGERREG